MTKALLATAFAVIITSEGRALDLDESIDQLDQTLRISAFNDNLRARLSGTLDLEAYHFTSPAPGLIDTRSDNLVNPRLSLFLDAQAGAQVYFFSQLRVDRGFDPSDNGVRVRLDEYALRLTPWASGVVNVQLGKFATVAGNWVQRHLSWDNPFINAPLPYEYVTAVSDIETPAPGAFFAQPTQKTKYEHVPFIWGPSYATGLSIAGTVSRVEYAIEVKNSSLSSRPEVWDATREGFSHPTVTGHVAFQPNETWKIGLTVSEGPYLREEALLPRGHEIGDYRQLLVGQDISVAWHHWQLWAEAYETRFEVPRLGNADAFAYYIEVKYKFLPQLFAAIRWNQEFFSTIPTVGDKDRTWTPDVWRIESAVTYRFTTHTQLKLQYYLEDAESLSHTLAAQFTVRF